MDSGSPVIPYRRAVEILSTYRWLWIAPTVIATVLSLGYAATMKRPWGATQSILVRDETGANLRGLGKFDTQEAMKTAQETILDLARNRASISGALKAIGPPANSSATDWPSPDDVDEAQDGIAIRAPNGTEFGKTELIYISVKRESRERAVAFLTALGDQLEARLRELRNVRFASIVEEIERRARVAKSELETATGRLQKLEVEVGSDLGELRTLSEAGTGEGNLRGQQNAIRNELRQAEAQSDSLKQLRELLTSAKANPLEFLATPSRLLESQPGLKRAKDNVLDAQAECARVAGMMSPKHPKVIECQTALAEMRQNLYRELAEAQRGIDADLQVSDGRVQSLNKQLDRVNQRLDQLATLRSQYVNLVSDVKRASEVLEKTNKELADARAGRSGATTANLISRIDAPVPSDRPIGPGRTTIVLAGIGGGLAFGLGLIFLVMPMKNPHEAARQTAAGSGPATSHVPPTGALIGGRRGTDPPLGGTQYSSMGASAYERRRGNRRRTHGRRTSDHVSPNDYLPPLIALSAPPMPTPSEDDAQRAAE